MKYECDYCSLLMKITYQQAKEAAIDLANTLGVMTDTAGHISGEGWSIDDYYFEITAGGKFRFEITADMVGEGFPQ